MKRQFIKIQHMRYKVTSIKRYEPFERPDLTEKFGVHVYFSMTGNSGRVYHTFETIEERDLLLKQLDETFGV